MWWASTPLYTILILFDLYPPGINAVRFINPTREFCIVHTNSKGIICVSTGFYHFLLLEIHMTVVV